MKKVNNILPLFPTPGAPITATLTSDRDDFFLLMPLPFIFAEPLHEPQYWIETVRRTRGYCKVPGLGRKLVMPPYLKLSKENAPKSSVVWWKLKWPYLNHILRDNSWAHLEKIPDEVNKREIFKIKNENKVFLFFN